MLMRFFLPLLLAGLAGALEVPPPADPEGLGERLAMLDYLRLRGVKARAGLDDAAVRTLYAEAWQADPANHARLTELLRAEAEATERVALRAEIARLGGDAGVITELEALKALRQRLEGEKREKQADEARELAVRGEMRLQQVKFRDGNVQLGLYDRSTHRIELFEAGTSKRIGEVQLNPASIAAVTDVVVKIHEAPALAGMNGQAPGCDGGWITDPEQAKRSAAAERRLIFALFTGSDWCTWCAKLDQEVLATPVFRAWAAKKVVLLKLDFPRQRQLPAAEQAANKALLERYGVKGFPSVLILHADGTEIARLGYREGGVQAWLAEADRRMPAR